MRWSADECLAEPHAIRVLRRRIARQPVSRGTCCSRDHPTLFDLGERRILREIIPKFVEGAGHDCANVYLASRQSVITTDPVPRPAAAGIGGDNDPFWFGWLLVTINASDIAGSGAGPGAFLAALALPRDYPAALLERLRNRIQ